MIPYINCQYGLEPVLIQRILILSYYICRTKMEGKICVITGASKGVGRGIVRVSKPIYISIYLTRDRGSTRCASARRQGGDMFEFRPDTAS